MSTLSLPEEEALSSPEEQERPSSRALSPVVATREALKMSDKHLSSRPMLHMAATPEACIPFILVCISVVSLDLTVIVSADFAARQSAIASADLAGKPSTIAYTYFGSVLSGFALMQDE
ncbi:uncharacterized protein LOC119320008 [Triticum dicoccoides]|uniref:uncharacterized protein LOC119320008 n=1 Tax=Triticum dicoccoides TaxID=85692 RepID=UPI001890E874|nr:uncharacterized protein LOC119320008 [Triticum dicoccoides]